MWFLVSPSCRHWAVQEDESVACSSGWSAEEHMACPRGAWWMAWYVRCEGAGGKKRQCFDMPALWIGLGVACELQCINELSKICNSSLFQALRMCLHWQERAAEQARSWLCVSVHPELMFCTNLEHFSAKRHTVPSEILGWCWQMLVIPKGVRSEKYFSWVSFPGPNWDMGSSLKSLIQSCFQACGICPVA